MLTRLTLLGAILLVGCQSVDTDKTLTSDMYAQVSATTKGDGTTVVRAIFLDDADSENDIELEGDDHLSAYLPLGQEKILREPEDDDIRGYLATFDTDEVNSVFIVGLSRIVDVSAPDSRVTLPAPFAITTAEGAELSRATDDIVIDWEDSGFNDKMVYRVSGDCIVSVEGRVAADPGSLTVPAADIVLRQGEAIDASCMVTLTLTRSRDGFVDTNYGLCGDAAGRQSRDFRFTTDP